jgi:hypothetical protein
MSIAACPADTRMEPSWCAANSLTGLACKAVLKGSLCVFALGLPDWRGLPDCVLGWKFFS